MDGVAVLDIKPVCLRFLTELVVFGPELTAEGLRPVGAHRVILFCELCALERLVGSKLEERSPKPRGAGRKHARENHPF